ncbi:16S rRNA (guanine(527)-N(7))-methyltransferase RsmG [Sphingomonas japonica]|uniref:Ribosomal RNA small subunit methyltransferase G n=1 Tax=Sphingomonas japonica TaxID=511662 RepID=A0ABX0U062_9SPHN|nr:16S rRNA (guanine(527)-N(7))-methyltransferase RsmG [Sphingomonas japonica]NIJ23485.1 16S rRNA (guanine527-N7)-methyltransferase [Sphingomonas japonica]
MTEDEARAWVREHYGVSRETRLANFAELVVQENERQNLVSPASVREMWSRHLVDSAQLERLGHRDDPGLWIDIGSGAGFPGLVVALLTDRPVLLAEPRRRRAEFLATAAGIMGCQNVEVLQSKIEAVPARTAVTISARAVAAIPSLFKAAIHLANDDTVWVFPKGRNAEIEVAEARGAWHGTFHVEQSITQPNSAIVIATGVRSR